MYLSEFLKSIDLKKPINPPPSWFQGRTVYGGLSCALAVQYILDELKPEKHLRLRSVQTSFVGPLTENLVFKAKLLRQSKSSSWYEVQCFSNDELGLTITCLFTTDRESVINHEFTELKEALQPENYIRLQNSFAPAMLANIDLRPAGGSLPVSGASNPEMVAWIKHMDDKDVNPYVSLIALADGLPPAAMATFTQFAPISSMNWNFDILRPIENSDWYLLRSNSLFSESGYSYQHMQLWDKAGNLILQGTQTVAIYL